MVLGVGGSQALGRPPTPQIPQPAALTFDWFRDAPVGVITYYEGGLADHPNLPNGVSPKWSIIAVDRVMLGTSASPNTEGGTNNFADVGVGLASAGAHGHDAHGSGAFLLSAGATTFLNSPVPPATHAQDGSHTHVVTPAKWHRSYILKKTVA